MQDKNMKIKVKKINPEARIPRYTINGDAAMELYSVENFTLKSSGLKVCPTGIAMTIPKGYVGLIWDKSGIALKKGIKTMGGVIDSNYCGEIGVLMKNLSDENYEINKGDKVAQMLIQKVENPVLEEVDDLKDTDRGENGFGSTGIR